MYIKKSRIHSAQKLLNSLTSGARYRICMSLDQVDQARLEAAGLPSSFAIGSTLLPAVIGPISQFNAEGRYIALKDKPKESRYITTIEWTWEQYAGRDSTKTVTEARDVYRDCYPREFIGPPSEEIQVLGCDAGRFVVSREFVKSAISAEELKHMVNLFLELFGECEVRNTDLSLLPAVKIKRLNWTILPPGAHPWQTVKKHTEQVINNSIHPRYSNIILKRQEQISQYEPDEVWVGNGGFRSYIAYVFTEKQLVVLESVLTGNATYIFGEHWMEFSKLSKAEILQNSFQEKRIIHSKGWKQSIHDLLYQHPEKAA